MYYFYESSHDRISRIVSVFVLQFSSRLTCPWLWPGPLNSVFMFGSTSTTLPLYLPKKHAHSFALCRLILRIAGRLAAATSLKWGAVASRSAPDCQVSLILKAEEEVNRKRGECGMRKRAEESKEPALHLWLCQGFSKWRAVSPVSHFKCFDKWVLATIAVHFFA